MLTVSKLLRRSATLLICGGLALALAGCGDNVRRSLGLTKQSPDEFRVVSRAPLVVPPSFNLRPPSPGAERPQEASPPDQARQAVFRAEPSEQMAAAHIAGNDSLSAGELSFLSRAAAGGSDQNSLLRVDRIN